MSQLMQERYGARSPRRRLLLIVLSALLGVTFISWLLWAALFHSDPPIKAEVSRYDITGIHEVKVQVSARFSPDDVDGTCLVRATARDHTIVGELNVTADELRAAAGTWIPVRTERRATTVEVISCRGAEQDS